MKYLNKIVFINSAGNSVKYAEINLDGNVHFIGTQGVGKSTLLRAILFFYNADKQKLGIPREKKTFDDYYFPYLNSYIIYEVQTDHTTYCILAFKTQGRVAFRFIDAPYSRNYFIDGEGKAFESWQQVRDSLGRNIYYSRIISGYEEYRNILYGNNKGLPAEFRKFALTESRQYQNIPRTITNVFLNANLSAEFVKETIIKSLNEEEVTIDLTTYSQNHLRDFENHLNDIRKWTELNRNGINPVEKQAELVTRYYLEYKLGEKYLVELAGQLAYALEEVKEQHPLVQKSLVDEETANKKLSAKLSNLDSHFDKKKEKIQEQIGKYKGKLEEIRKKKNVYAELQIETLLDRVAQKPGLELTKNNLISEKEILTAQFREIQQRYAALLDQLNNRLIAFRNARQIEKNGAKEEYLNYKDELANLYDSIIEDISNQHRDDLNAKMLVVNEKNKEITRHKIYRSEIQGKRFFETEIQGCMDELTELAKTVMLNENSLTGAGEKIKNIRKEWELETSEIKGNISRQLEKENEVQNKLKEKVSAIDLKLERSKNSLYGWLNEKVPGWQETIGKVIDEETVLFGEGLNPQKLIANKDSFYGIGIDLQEIGKSVKTVADYQAEREDLLKLTDSSRKAAAQLNAGLTDELEKLKKKFQPIIKNQKQIILNCEFNRDKYKNKTDELNVRLNDLKEKAQAKKVAELQAIEASINRLREEKGEAEALITKIENTIKRLVNTRKKEKDKKLRLKQQELELFIKESDRHIEKEQKEISKKQALIKLQQKEEFEAEGANTLRIEEIDQQLSEIDAELIFIDNNRDLVAEYRKDKRELFDREDEYKTQKNLCDKQLDTELTKHLQQREKISRDINESKDRIDALNGTLDEFTSDENEFDRFSKSEIFPAVKDFLENDTERKKTDKRCSTLINEIKENYYSNVNRMTDLQSHIIKFAGNFNDNNLFSFSVKFSEKEDYFKFAEMLQEFIAENKIGEYRKRFEERFARIIQRIGIETGDLISREGEISQVIRDINNDFLARNFVGAVKRMELRTINSTNRIFQLLVEIKNFNDENSHSLGQPNLFSPAGQTGRNEKAITLLKQLIKEMTTYREKEISLSDSFELEFRIVENNNDTGWVEKLTNVGSEGTDTLVKAMINIMLLNVFKERAARKRNINFRLHCMMDEIGKLHPTNVKGILKFANDRNILLINGSPTSYNATDYRYTYLLARDPEGTTNVRKLVKKILKPQSESTPQVQ